MPFQMEIDHGRKLVRIIGSGAATMPERHDCIRDVLRDVRSGDPYNAIINVANVTTAPTEQDRMMIGMLVSKLMTHLKGKLAIVNSRPGHILISAFIAFDAEGRNLPVRTFLTEMEAMSWFTPHDT